MIKINKDVRVPATLRNRGAKLTESLKREFDKLREDYLEGRKKFVYKTIYNNKTVVGTLRKCQHNKCCFSEAKFTVDYPHVEHFRPKGKVNENLSPTFLYPGYYWLAYDWKNLFLCKSKTNVSHKRNFFPLEVESDRNRSHRDNNPEQPLLIDPSSEDPRQHIRFHKDEPYHLSERGRVTIELLNLRHPELEEARRTRFTLLTAVKDLLHILIERGVNEEHEKVVGCKNELKKSVQTDAEFSSMAIDLAANFDES